MKIMYEVLDFNGHNSIKVKWDEFPHFTFPWHYHPELEIVYVIESYGNRYVGDSVEKFTKGDLVLLGSNLPHFWKNHDDYYMNDPSLQVKAIVVQFPSSIIENVEFPEFRNIKHLIDQSKRGIQYKEPVISMISKKLFSLLELDGLKRYLMFLEILEIMSTTKSHRFLGSINTKHYHPTSIDRRLEKILCYLNNNFTEEYSLKDLSQLIGMNETALCRYFKSKTGKSIVEYLHDIRIGYACELLIEHRKNISEVAYQCGFNNISNFNRIFKRKTNYTPSDYLKEMIYA